MGCIVFCSKQFFALGGFKNVCLHLLKTGCGSFPLFVPTGGEIMRAFLLAFSHGDFQQISKSVLQKKKAPRFFCLLQARSFVVARGYMGAI